MDNDLQLELVGAGAVGEDAEISESVLINNILMPLFDYLREREDIRIDIVRADLFTNNVCTFEDKKKMNLINAAHAQDPLIDKEMADALTRKLYSKPFRYLHKFGINVTTGQYFHLHSIIQPCQVSDTVEIRILRAETGFENPDLFLVFNSTLDKQASIIFNNHLAMQIIADLSRSDFVEALNLLHKMQNGSCSYQETLQLIESEHPIVNRIKVGLQEYGKSQNRSTSAFSSLAKSDIEYHSAIQEIRQERKRSSDLFNFYKKLDIKKISESEKNELFSIREDTHAKFRLS